MPGSHEKVVILTTDKSDFPADTRQITGLTGDPVGRLIKTTALNPALTLPLLLIAYYTQRGQSFTLDHTTIAKRIRLLFYLGLVRWASGYLDNGVLNNWKKDDYTWSREIVVVTGGSDGIGMLVVKLLAEKGIKVAVLDVQPLTFEHSTSNIRYYKCDITSPSAIASAASEVRSSFGNPTILINNAGVARGKTILDSTENDVRLTFDVNTLSHYFLTKEFVPHMVRTNHGMIVTVASLASYVTAPQMVDYCASKAAALSFHEGLTAELKTRYNAPKVRTVAVTPGYTKTRLFTGFRNDSTFLIPTLEPETVAEGIVQKVLSGTSGQIILPGGGRFLSMLRGWPHWLQHNVRKDTDRSMTEWKGRQVIDPEEKYSAEAKTVE
ncbi:MAG: hypothetical protein M1835_007064 [Candelina submexicana]|nr:MAG: hypothetical protein M1835_007064 [Candelina submexicana]